MTEVPELVTRKPTGKPPWPMMLLAGREKSGKSWSAAAFSASQMIGRTFYCEIGEHYADEYGAIPGARYEILQHDGTYRGIGTELWKATKQPRIDGKPNAIIVDSITALWDMLSEQAQRTANRRWRAKNPKAPEPEDEVPVTVDLWNAAKDRFGSVIDLLREHDGPVILTGRLELVTVMAGGKPTTDKTWKVRAEKNLPFEVDVVVQAREPRTWEITGLRSTRLELPVGKTIPLPGFSIEDLLRRLGLDEEGATAPRSVTLPKPDGTPSPQQQRPQQPPRSLADDDQKRQLAILCGQKLGITERAKRLHAMSGRFKRLIGSFDEMFAAEAATAIRELRGKPDFAPPATQQVYDRLHAAIADADLDSIGQALSTATEARDAGLIPPAAWEALSDFAEARAKILIADAAGECGWDPADGDSTVPADVQHLQGVPA